MVDLFAPTADDELERLRLYDQSASFPVLPRPSWDDYFMGLAFIASQRSPDLSTKHGCVLVDKDNHVVGTGYNGFYPGADDEFLATLQPKPYFLINHSEVNAVENCTVKITKENAVRAYVTGQVCLECAEFLVANGVKHFIMAERRGFSNPDAGDGRKFDELAARSGVFVERIKPNLTWLTNPKFISDLRQHGFV